MVSFHYLFLLMFVTLFRRKTFISWSKYDMDEIDARDVYGLEALWKLALAGGHMRKPFAFWMWLGGAAGDSNA